MVLSTHLEKYGIEKSVLFFCLIHHKLLTFAPKCDKIIA